MHGVESTAKGVKLVEYKEFHVASGVLDKCVSIGARYRHGIIAYMVLRALAAVAESIDYAKCRHGPWATRRSTGR